MNENERKLAPFKCFEVHQYQVSGSFLLRRRTDEGPGEDEDEDDEDHSSK
jgi:hypothetical protein